ncbi:MAG: TonB-dependent copper receptor [Pseudomonadales bacterium]
MAGGIRAIGCGVAALSMAMALPAWASETVPADGQGGSYEAEIVVTAPRTEGPLEVVTDPGKPRQPLPAHDGADYLKTIPGFSVVRKGGTDGDPLFRGMAGSRINVLSEEAMLLGGCGQRMDPPTAYVFPQNYDRIRILKGPQSVLWGAGGSAATVLFERDPFDYRTDTNKLDISALAASWNRRDLALDGLVGNETGYLRLQGSDARADDYQDGDGNDVHSEYHRWNANASLGWTPDEDTLIELSGARSDGEAAYADRAMDGARFDREALTLRVRRSNVAEHVSLIDAHVAYGYVDHVMDNYSVREFVPSMMMPNPTVSNPDRETIAARIAATVAFTDALQAVLGFDGHDDEHSVRNSMNQLMMPYQSLPRLTDARFEQRGLFGEFTWEAAPGRVWAWGARFDHWQVHDERDMVRQGMMMMVPNATAGASESNWLSSAYLRYEHGLKRVAASVEPEVILFAGLGYSERTADYWERFGNDKQSLDTNSAFHTDPERTTQLDLGMLRRTEASRLSASLFVSRIDDYILIDAMPTGKPMGTVVTRNVQAGTWGGELEYGAQLGAAWMLESSLAYTRGDNRSDDRPLAQMPPLEARVSLVYTADRFTLGGLVRWVADQDRVDIGRGNVVGQDVAESDDFTVLSVNGSYALSRSVNLSAGVDNLLDDAYAEHLSRAGASVPGFVQTERVLEPGRTLWLKLDVHL